jgi:hypothetical protein
MRFAKCFAFVGFLSVTVFASAQTFDFESATATYSGSGARPGALTSLTQVSGGLTMTITRDSGLGFDVHGFTTPDPAFGKRWLDGFNITNVNRPMILSFDQTLSEFSIWAGQFTASQQRTAVMKAYSGPGGTGSLVKSVTSTIPGFTFGLNSAWTGTELKMQGVTFSSVTVEMTGPFFNGFLDQGKATVAVVPEPTTMLALSFGGLALLRRHKRA